MVETNKENLRINKIVFEKEETFLLEEDMIVPDSKPDIINAINTSGNICIYKKELQEEKLKIDGNINANVMYIPDNVEENVRGINVSLDFSKAINAPNCKPGMILETNLQIKNINCNVINGRKINIKAEVIAKIKVYSNEEISIINDIVNNKDIQIARTTCKVNSLVGSGKTKAYVKETVAIDNTDNLAEILKVNINMVDRDVKISYNKVLAKTEAEIRIMYLTEDNRIETTINKIPVVGFIDIQDVTEENLCDTNYEIRNMVIKPNNAEEHSIYVEIEVEISCNVYEEKEINLINDLYSPIEKIECDKKQITTMADKTNRSEKCTVKDTLNIPELGENGLINSECTPKIINTNKSNSKIIYEGEVEVKFIFLNMQNQINQITSIVPFEFTVDNTENADTLNITTNMEVNTQDFVVKSGGDVVMEIGIIFNIDMCKNQNLNIINNIELVENTSTEDYSLIIYIVKKGDTLWNIAKKLNSTVDDIVRTNNIENPDIINIGEKLYIPRFKRYA